VALGVVVGAAVEGWRRVAIVRLFVSWVGE
jgi:hypothetical protein